MNIIIRVDSSITIGSGHLMRCLTLANELRNFGAEISFVCREHPGNLISKLEESSYFVYRLPCSPPKQLTNSDDYAAWLGVPWEQDAEETRSAVNGRLYDWLIVDHYGLDARWEQLVKPITKHILVLDDLANRHHSCDLLVDQNYFGFATESRYKDWLPVKSRCLLGPRYALLQPEYKLLRQTLPPHDGQIQQVLIFFGGSDEGNQTVKALTALMDPALAHLSVDVVIGPNHPNPESIIAIASTRKGTTLHRNLPSLSALMRQADLFVGAGGATTWERMSLGLPSLVISVAPNQQEFTDLLVADGFQRSLANGKLASSTEWCEAIVQLIKMPEHVKQLAQRAQKLVDALGANRIAKAMCGIKMYHIKIRQVSPLDEKLLWEWANDPEVRMQSFNQKQINENDHTQWFRRKCEDPNCRIFIGEDQNGIPIGQVRFEIDRKNNEVIIGISLDNSYRGFGLSEELLRKSMQELLSLGDAYKFIAEVRDENQYSQQLFKKLQFTSISSRRIGAKCFALDFKKIIRKIEKEDVT